MDGINRSLSTHLPLHTETATATHGAEGAHGTGAVNQVSAATAETEIRAISEYLKTQVFAGHKQAPVTPPRDVSAARLTEINAHNAGVTRNNAQLDAIADSRARVLHGLNETPATIADTLAKAEKLDRLASRSSSAFRAIPFASATVLQYAKPEITQGAWLPAPLQPLTPFISGAVSGIMDQVGTGVMNRVTDDAHYLKAPAAKLHDALAESARRNAPGLTQKSVDMGVGIQGYSARNLLRAGVATTLAGSPKAQALTDTVISSAGGLVANGLFGNRMHTTENRDHQRGGAFIFGRKDTQPKPLDDETDWLAAYQGVKNASYSGAALNAGKRLAGMPLDILTDSSKAVRSLVSATSLTQNGLALAGGFAGVGKLQEMATKNITNPYLKTAVSQLTNTAASSAVFAGWTTAGVVTGPATEAAEDLLQNGVKNAASATASFVGDQAAAGGRAVGSLADRTTRAAVTTAADLRAEYDNHVRRRDRNPDIDMV